MRARKMLVFQNTYQVFLEMSKISAKSRKKAKKNRKTGVERLGKKEGTKEKK
jgi:hypothetical protein